MRKIIIIVLLAITLLMSFCSDYDTNFPPPEPNATFKDVFPLQIADKKGTLKKIEVPKKFVGIKVVYGKADIKITVIQANGNDEADEYFKKKIAPIFDLMPSHFRGKLNGKWYAKGKKSGGFKAFAWVNKNWIFMIEAKNKEFFDKAIDEFIFISE